MLPVRTVGLIDGLGLQDYGTKGRAMAAVAFLLSNGEPKKALKKTEGYTRPATAEQEKELESREPDSR